MCGIAGLICSGKPLNKHVLLAFIEKLRHRGPDDSGYFVNETGVVGFAHTRLSILDLSTSGHQPMALPDGRYTIVFNGEIYNFRELRAELQFLGRTFVSDCDTEVLLHLYAECGEKMLDRLEGMFAFAIWDEVKQTCFLARDPLAIKPLYYWHQNGHLAFASELRTVLAAKLETPQLDQSAIAQYFLFGSVAEPASVVSNVRTLPAGHWGLWRDGTFVTHSYWEPRYRVRSVGESEAVSITRLALDESIRRHFVSDVPVGIFLSGGMDSTALVALARANGFQDIKTFCISFDENDFNEGETARRTAEHFGTEHHDWRLTSADGANLVKDFLLSTDSPSNDGFNTYCVSKFARSKGMKVVLSGLGGDEMFGSYPSFRSVPKLLRLKNASKYMLGINKLLAACMRNLSSDFRIQRLAELVGISGEGKLAAYWAMRGFFTPIETRKLVQRFTSSSSEIQSQSLLSTAVPALPTPQDLVAYLETTRYMRNQLLRDSDVYSMVHGLELRVPFVDRKLFDAVASIPAAIRLAPGKKLLADAVPEIPEWVVNAPKRGFRFPFEDWVVNQWGDTFNKSEEESPVTLGSWYRKWIYFGLDNFLKTNGLAI